ncbi:hypothetical protein K9L67_02175 [Candidatus Woesearchaeota archaeon]|nr:hypothetical protein [Candidatus Woesearchaeota archaeon]MCF7901011.1 hypothetical protein [Candidatus Woesearchaeota archaeon]MCF8013273.1 hypothetical protein [Candidatus Woesearchaeota archaeon]
MTYTNEEIKYIWKLLEEKGAPVRTTHIKIDTDKITGLKQVPFNLNQDEFFKKYKSRSKWDNTHHKNPTIEDLTKIIYESNEITHHISCASEKSLEYNTALSIHTEKIITLPNKKIWNKATQRTGIILTGISYNISD